MMKTSMILTAVAFGLGLATKCADEIAACTAKDDCASLVNLAAGAGLQCGDVQECKDLFLCLVRDSPIPDDMAMCADEYTSCMSDYDCVVLLLAHADEPLKDCEGNGPCQDVMSCVAGQQPPLEKCDVETKACLENSDCARLVRDANLAGEGLSCEDDNLECIELFMCHMRDTPVPDHMTQCADEFTTCMSDYECVTIVAEQAEEGLKDCKGNISCLDVSSCMYMSRELPDTLWKCKGHYQTCMQDNECLTQWMHMSAGSTFEDMMSCDGNVDCQEMTRCMMAIDMGYDGEYFSECKEEATACIEDEGCFEAFNGMVKGHIPVCDQEDDKCIAFSQCYVKNYHEDILMAEACPDKFKMCGEDEECLGLVANNVYETDDGTKMWSKALPDCGVNDFCVEWRQCEEISRAKHGVEYKLIHQAEFQMEFLKLESCAEVTEDSVRDVLRGFDKYLTADLWTSFEMDECKDVYELDETYTPTMDVTLKFYSDNHAEDYATEIEEAVEDLEWDFDVIVSDISYDSVLLRHQGNPEKGKKDYGLSGGAIAGIVIAVLVFLGIVAGAIFCVTSNSGKGKSGVRKGSSAKRKGKSSRKPQQSV